MKAPTPQLWVALLLPIVAFAVLVVRAELLRASGPVFRVAIAGYDPRDLLQGHYLRYRLQWPALGACDGATCCLCRWRSAPSLAARQHRSPVTGLPRSRLMGAFWLSALRTPRAYSGLSIL